ncbi:hypothetical protein [Botrimarina colliarenosi]|uniref:hypothetical protein n=1 Tax=Botrimarina colliarenosi TaxID=2528001 RepID=UPI0011B822AF|nr:hypothetical protein [Botrimarina colliarenosi]
MNNTFAAVDEPGQRYYGRDGYALFGTRFDYPNANAAPGSSGAPGDTFFESLFPNLIDLPDFIVDSQILASKVVGGYGYVLIDDPQITAGIVDFQWGESQSPQSFGQRPYVKLGILDGWDQFGNDPANVDGLPAGRWGFEVGADTPASFRLGVMVDGTDNANFVPGEIFLANVTALGSGSVNDFVSSGAIPSNRFVDMHFFDISDAQEGDLFAVGVKSRDGAISFGNSGISGFSFDILPEVAGLAGDYTGDGKVDAADYTMWRDTYGDSVAAGAGADGDGDGAIGDGDYTVWAEGYGGVPSTIAVPEPGAVTLCLVLLAGLASRRQ